MSYRCWWGSFEKGRWWCKDPVKWVKRLRRVQRSWDAQRMLISTMFSASIRKIYVCFFSFPIFVTKWSGRINLALSKYRGISAFQMEVQRSCEWWPTPHASSYDTRSAFLLNFAISLGMRVSFCQGREKSFSGLRGDGSIVLCIKLYSIRIYRIVYGWC